MIWKILCRLGLCLGGVVCDHGKATCNKCGYCSRYGKGHNAPELTRAEGVGVE